MCESGTKVHFEHHSNCILFCAVLSESMEHIPFSSILFVCFFLYSCMSHPHLSETIYFGWVLARYIIDIHSIWLKWNCCKVDLVSHVFLRIHIFEFVAMFDGMKIESEPRNKKSSIQIKMTTCYKLYASGLYSFKWNSSINPISLVEYFP